MHAGSLYRQQGLCITTTTKQFNCSSVLVTLTRRFSIQSGLRGSFHSANYLKDKVFIRLSIPHRMIQNFLENKVIQGTEK